MGRFSQRSKEKELLDQPNIDRKELYLNLKELHNINSLLGGYQVIFLGLRKLFEMASKKRIRLLDIGSGGGDTLRMIAKKFGKQHQLELTGVDLKADCISYSRSKNEAYKITFIESDYRDLIRGGGSYDVIIASLFCHHLTDSEIIELLKWMKENAQVGFVINDIHRHPLAYYSIKWLTRFFSKSRLVKNDAPLSVLRAFSKKELKMLLCEAGIVECQIKWVWAFRWMVWVQKDTKNDI